MRLSELNSYVKQAKSVLVILSLVLLCSLHTHQLHNLGKLLNWQNHTYFMKDGIVIFRHSHSETLLIWAEQTWESARYTWRGTNHHSHRTVPNQQTCLGCEGEDSPQKHKYCTWNYLRHQNHCFWKISAQLSFWLRFVFFAFYWLLRQKGNTKLLNFALNYASNTTQCIMIIKNKYMYASKPEWIQQ